MLSDFIELIVMIFMCGFVGTVVAALVFACVTHYAPIVFVSYMLGCMIMVRVLNGVPTL